MSYLESVRLIREAESGPDGCRQCAQAACDGCKVDVGKPLDGPLKV
jgi:hypothetical protein